MKVWVEIPSIWDELIKKAMVLEGWEKRTDYIRELIKKDLVSKGLLGNGGKNEGKNGQIEETVLEEG
jgi:hypothetical protein